MAPQFICSRFLICEGPDDKGFLESLVERHRLPDFQICHAAEFNGWDEGQIPTGGKSGIKKSLERIDVLRGFEGLRAVLIITDNDHAKAFRDLQKELKGICTVPDSPSVVGSIYGKPLAVFMIPSADECGDLETYCLPEIHRHWPRSEQCVTEFLTASRALQWTKQSSINKAKARAAVVGFHQPDPYKGVGHLFKSGVLETGNARFRPLIDFLNNFDAFVGI